MSLKNILVHVDEAGGAATRIEAAARLAADHDACLTGLHVRPAVDLSFFAQTLAGPALNDTLRKAADAVSERVRAQFEQHAAGHAKRRWQEATGTIADEVIARSRYSDLVVLGPSDADQPSGRRLSGQVVLGAGLPVLVVPERPAVSTPGRRVLIAWNASAEAMRAVRGALPILRKAALVEVTIIVVGTPDDTADPPPGQPLVGFLAEHGVTATVRLVRLDEVHGVAGTVLARAGAIGADLIVMGAFGRSRLREAMIGSTTGTLITRSTVPLFIGH